MTRVENVPDPEREFCTFLDPDFPFYQSVKLWNEYPVSLEWAKEALYNTTALLMMILILTCLDATSCQISIIKSASKMDYYMRMN